MRWTGLLLPKTTGTHVIRIEADYACAVKIGTRWIINEWDSTIAVSERAQYFLTENQPEPIEIWYRHQAGTAYIRLYWSSTGFQDQLIPPESLLYSLNVFNEDTFANCIAAEASEKSLVCRTDNLYAATQACEVDVFKMIKITSRCC